MAKAKRVENVGMVSALPNMVTFPGGFHWLVNEQAVNAIGSLADAFGMSAKGLFYLIQYGANKSGQDCVAGLAKELDEAVNEDGTPKYDATEKAVIFNDEYSARFNAIVAGDIGHRTQGPRIKGVDKVIREVVWEIILNAATLKGVAGKLPKKATEQLAMVEKYLADGDRAASARAEAERRMGVAATTGTDEMDELLAGL